MFATLITMAKKNHYQEIFAKLAVSAMWSCHKQSPLLWLILNYEFYILKVKWSRYRLGVAQRVGRGIALLFHDRGTRRWWVVSSTPRPLFTSGKDRIPILQEAGWAPGPVWTGRKPRPHRDSIPDRPGRSQSLYRLSYPAHTWILFSTQHKAQGNFTITYSSVSTNLQY